MKKKILILFLITICFFSVFSIVGCGGQSVLKFKKKIGATGEDEYVVIGMNSPTANVVIPAVYDGLPVVEIEEGAFSDSDVKSVVVPDSVERIGYGAFSGCNNLEEISVPFVGERGGIINAYFAYIFGANSSSESEKVPASLKKVKITSGERIVSEAFWECDNIESIEISSTVTNISENSFFSCTSLANIEVDENNAKYCSFEGNLYSKNKAELIQYAIGKKNSSFVIPNTVERIGAKAFSRSENLTSITIPNSVADVASTAFSDCTKLEYNIKNNLKYLGDNTNPYLYLVGPTSKSITSATVDSKCKFIASYAFKDCNSLERIELPFVGSKENASGYESVFGFIFGYTYSSSGHSNYGVTQYYSGSTWYVYYIPSSLKSVKIARGEISRDAFRGCEDLTSVTIGSDVTSVGEDAFWQCELTVYCEKTSIPSGWTNIGDSDDITIYLYKENEPTTSGNFWHYVNGVETKWQ